MPRSRTTSATWTPIRLVGLRPTIGSCGTRPTTEPRSRRSVRSLAPAVSTPSTIAEPAVIRPLAGSRPMIALAVVVDPEPMVVEKGLSSHRR